MSPEPSGGGLKRRIAIIFGGRSAEHEISVASAQSVLKALDPERYEVLAIGIDKEGRWHHVPSLPERTSPGALAAVAGGQQVVLSPERGDPALVTDDGTRREVDVVFPLLHGPYG